MLMTPEEYFAEQSLEVPMDMGAALTPAEEAFVRKYLGSEVLGSMPPEEAEALRAGAAAAPRPAAGDTAPPQAERASQPPMRTRLAAMPQVQMVSFYVRGQIYLLPVFVIVEVLRHMPLTRVPMAPPYMAGIINLRGKITPLLHLDALLTTERQYRYAPESRIIICGTREMQLGLIFDKLHTMYMVEQKSISWNVEAYLGSGAEFLCGMADIADHLHAIVDPEMIVDKLLED